MPVTNTKHSLVKLFFINANINIAAPVFFNITDAKIERK